MTKETIKLIGTIAALAIVAIVMITLGGCKKAEPTAHPTFQNFDMVRVTLSGEKAQITNNQFEFDYDKNCWKVRIKMLKESQIGGMLKKFSGKDSVKFGTEEKTVHEGELEPYAETKD